MPDIRIERLKRLPQRADERWQGGLVRLPLWVNDGPTPRRPMAPVWVAVEAHKVHSGEFCTPDEQRPEMALDALVEFACDRTIGGYRPAEVQVRDAALAAYLEPRLADAGIAVTRPGPLPALDEMLEMFEARASRKAGGTGRPVPPLADGRGTSLPLIRSFAEAARRFYDARPWIPLCDMDLIRVHAPKVPRDLSHVLVLGHEREVYGLTTFASLEAFWRFLEATGARRLEHRGWHLWFDPITSLPLRDADLWLDEGLAVAGPDAYPLPIRQGRDGRFERPAGATLRAIETVLLALAETTEDDLDRGQWSRTVTTSAGPVECELSLPHLLDPPPPERLWTAGVSDHRANERVMAQIGRFVAGRVFDDLGDLNEAIAGEFEGHTAEQTAAACPPRTPLEAAQDLCYEAFATVGRGRVVLARRALEACADCADAYVILAEHDADPERAAELFALGVEAGERALAAGGGDEAGAPGAGGDEEEPCMYWGDHATRPMMRARHGLGRQCLKLGRLEDAAEQFAHLLAINPGDNQGVRYALVPCLIRLGRYDEAERIVEENADDAMTFMPYAAALLAFRRDGDGAGARRRLAEALRRNRAAGEMLAERRDVPRDTSGGWSPGDEREAVVIAEELGEAWRETRGAVDWLRGATGSTGSEPPRRRFKQRKRRSR